MRNASVRIGIIISLALLISLSGFAQTRIISTYAGLPLPVNGALATTQAIDHPQSVAPDGAGGLYVVSSWQHRVYRIAADGRLSIIAGTGAAGYGGDGGPSTSAQLRYPRGMAVDAAGNLYIADSGNARIRVVTPGGVIRTVAGNGAWGYSGDGGPATSAQLRYPYSVEVDTAGSLYIADTFSYRIRRVTPAGVISTVAGNGTPGYSGDGGPATSAQLNIPGGVAVDTAGNLYIADTYNHGIRRVTPGGVISTVAGNGAEGYSGDRGPATSAQLRYPCGVAVDMAGNLYIADTQNHRIRKVRIHRPPWDADADGKADIAVWRPDGGGWFTLPSSAPGSFVGRKWGLPGDLPVPGDYDGDSRSDAAVWRPGSATWYTLPSGTPGGFTSTQWGVSTDLPVPADYDSDGKDDVAVWRPTDGTWYVLPSGSPGTFTAARWGQPGDIPVPADYDGDGKTDMAVWRPANGIWYIVPSDAPESFTGTQWGASGDVPVPGDYDGDGKTDIAVWRPGNGSWYVLPSASPGSFTARQWGVSTDIPVAGDYDCDGKTDIGVWRPDSAVWYLTKSADPGSYISTQWGVASDVPLSPLAQILRSRP